MDLSRYAELFLTESQEHLSTCNNLLLEWEQHPKKDAPVDGLFRALHTLKGMAATMGYGIVAALAHNAESVLDGVRAKRIAVTSDLIQLFFRTVDRLEEAIAAAVDGDEQSVDIADLVEALEASVGQPRGAGRRSTVMLSRADTSDGAPRVEVTVDPDAPLKGARAVLVLRQAAESGVVGSVEPAPELLQDQSFDGVFSFTLISDGSLEEVIADIRRIGDVRTVRMMETEAAVAPTALADRERTLRVALSRLDRLMNGISELAIGRNRLAQMAERIGDGELVDELLQADRLVQDLQREILAARMTPVGEVFDRFPRLVRDVARELGKEVVFRAEGRDIELDRAIVDELAEPLVHLVRNAIDHGLESPAVRKKAGKPRQGRLTVAATREANSVSIRISDDGAGIDRSAVAAQASVEGLGEAGDLSDGDLLALIMRPGFSTASEVSQVSGRGVGIDIVNTRMRALGGALEMATVPGSGTTFTMRLPVTLSIIRALVAGVGGERYALPLTHVAETLDFDPRAATQVNGRDVLMLGEDVLPLVFLGHLVGAPEVTERGRRVPPSVIVLELGDRRSGVVVDQMLGQHEIVVKSFAAPRGTLPIFSGATILADGRPALILDAGGLM